MFLRVRKHKVIIMNWKSVTIIVAFSMLSFTLSLIHSIFAYLSIIPLSIFILDESSDAFFEEIYDSLTPAVRYGISITLLAFIVSLDEIMVSISSIMTGYAEISAGALIGSDAITVLMVVLILMAVRRKLDYRKTIPYVIFPAFLIGAGILSEYLNLSWISNMLYAATILISVVVLIAISSKILKSTGKMTKSETGTPFRNIAFGAFYLSFLTVGAYYLSFSTVEVSSYYNISYFIGGYVIAGVVGSLPEYFMIRDSMKNGNTDDASGIFVGSTIIKGTILLPLVSIFFGYSYPLDNFFILFSIICTVTLIPFMKVR